MHRFHNSAVLAFAVVVVLVAISQSADAQITFSRDWLAGSGKRSSKVTFSRDWLAGSGKRDAPVNRISVDADRNAVASRAAIKLFMEYLALQMEDSPIRDISLYEFLQTSQKL